MSASRHAVFSPVRRRVLGWMAAPALLDAGTLAAPDARAADLASVTLVLGDQAGGTRALVEAAHALEGAPYAFRWANFQGAAPLFEAQRAGAVDLATAGDLPVLAAATGDPDLRIVATRVGQGSMLGILVQKDAPIHSVADLKGRRVAVSSARGSISQYQLYGALAEAGLTSDDVEVRFILPIDAFAAFSAGTLEAWATFDPYYGIAEQSRAARVLRDGSGIYSGLGFFTAPHGVLTQPDKRAAIADVLRRFQRASEWALAHPDAYARVYATLTRAPLDAARQITRRAPLRQHFVSGEDIATLQKIADTGYREGILPARVEVRAIADPAIANA